MKPPQDRIRDIANSLPSVAECDLAQVDLRNIATEIEDSLKAHRQVMPQDVRDEWEFIVKMMSFENAYSNRVSKLAQWLAPRLKMLDAQESCHACPAELCEALGMEGASIDRVLAEVTRLKAMADSMQWHDAGTSKPDVYTPCLVLAKLRIGGGLILMVASWNGDAWSGQFLDSGGIGLACRSILTNHITVVEWCVPVVPTRN